MRNMPGTPVVKSKSVPDTPSIVTRYILTPRVVPQSNRTNRSSGYGYTNLDELTLVPASYTNECCTRTRTHPRVFWHGRTELTDVSGTGMNVVQNLQKLRVRV